jgi:hypothetical protein
MALPDPMINLQDLTHTTARMSGDPLQFLGGELEFELQFAVCNATHIFAPDSCEEQPEAVRHHNEYNRRALLSNSTSASAAMACDASRGIERPLDSMWPLTDKSYIFLR